MRSEIEIKTAVVVPPAATKPRGRLRKFVMRPMFCSVCASIGIFGGLSALFIGIVCVIVHAVLASDRVFDRVGTVLLIFAIPMILIGSIFVDEINSRI